MEPLLIINNTPTFTYRDTHPPIHIIPRMEVSDATDWDQPEMREFERKLRCPICQDFYRASVMLRVCSHNFCSLCIRKSLSVTPECPVCRQNASTTDLETNRIIDELVLNFVNVRPLILKGLSLSLNPNYPPANEQFTTPQNPCIQNSNLTACPVCEVEFPTLKIEEHVDLCLSRDESGRGKRTGIRSTTANNPSMKRANKPVYNLLKDGDVKKLLIDWGLSTSGDRDAWIRRHSEFLMLYNAECDAPNPKSISELKSELRALERAWNKKCPNIDLGNADEDFDLAASSYRKRNADHFKQLIENAKKPSKAT